MIKWIVNKLIKMNMKNVFMIFLVIATFFSCNMKQSELQTTPNEKVPVLQLSSAAVFTTAKDTDLRLTQNGTYTFAPGKQPIETELYVFVNPDKTFQTFIGIGGAITDASAEVFAKLPQDKQEELLNAYYSKEGIGYSLMRTNIHSCDFSSGSYTYIEDGDTELSTFSVAIVVGTGVEIGAEALNAGKFRVGPLGEQLVHHLPLEPRHCAVRGIAAIPVGHGENAAGAEHAQQFIGVTLFVGHVRTGLDAPHGIKVAVGELQIEGIHHRKAATQTRGGEAGARAT